MRTVRVPNRVLQSRNPEGYYWQPTSRFLPRFCFKIPNPEFQLREIPDPKKPIGDPHLWLVGRSKEQFQFRFNAVSVLGYVHPIQDSSYADTKTTPDRASVHT